MVRFKFSMLWRGLQCALCVCLVMAGTVLAQDVVIEDPLPLLQTARTHMANRPLVRLGTVNPYLHRPERATSPYNTTMLVYDPLNRYPEGAEVTEAMLRQEVIMRRPSFFERLRDSVKNFFQRR